MNKSLLKQMLTYFSKVYNLGEKIKRIIDTRLEPKVETFTILYIVLMGFMLQVPSFNRLESWIKKGKLKKLLPRKTELSSIDIVRNCLHKVDLDSLNNMNKKDIIPTSVVRVKEESIAIDTMPMIKLEFIFLFCDFVLLS